MNEEVNGWDTMSSISGEHKEVLRAAARSVLSLFASVQPLQASLHLSPAAGLTHPSRFQVSRLRFIWISLLLLFGTICESTSGLQCSVFGASWSWLGFGGGVLRRPRVSPKIFSRDSCACLEHISCPEWYQRCDGHGYCCEFLTSLFLGVFVCVFWF